MLERELAYFEQHRAEWLRAHPGECAVIRGETVLGFYPTMDDGFRAGIAGFRDGAFLVKRVQVEDDTASAIHACWPGRTAA